MFKVEIIKVYFSLKLPYSCTYLVTSKTILDWFPDKSLCAKLDFNRWSRSCNEENFSVVSLDQNAV
jgi:hypothetical protein